jgi:hypothetical protein
MTNIGQFWARGVLAASESDPNADDFYTTMDEGSCMGYVALGQWIPCSNDCKDGNVKGYIVEFESSGAYVTEYADSRLGASVVATSTLTPGSGNTFRTSGDTIMRANLVQPNVTAKGIPTTNSSNTDALFSSAPFSIVSGFDCCGLWCAPCGCVLWCAVVAVCCGVLFGCVLWCAAVVVCSTRLHRQNLSVHRVWAVG